MPNSKNTQKKQSNPKQKSQPKPKQKEVEHTEPEEVVPEEVVPEEVEQQENVETSTSGTTRKKVIKYNFNGSTEEAEKEIAIMLEKMTDMQKQVNSEFTEYKNFLRDLSKSYMRLRKLEDKNKEKQTNRKLQTRISPLYKITPELAEFLNIEEDQSTSRTNALAQISKYVKENNLNGVEVDDEDGGKKVDGRLIRLDEKLEKLFPNLVGADECLKFTSILTHLKINKHFVENINNKN